MSSARRYSRSTTAPLKSGSYPCSLFLRAKPGLRGTFKPGQILFDVPGLLTDRPQSASNIIPDFSTALGFDMERQLHQRRLYGELALIHPFQHVGQRIVTRLDKLAKSYAAMVSLACSMRCLRHLFSYRT